MRLRLLVVMGSLVSFGVFQACGGDDTLDGGADGSPPDATVDNFVPPPDSGNDATPPPDDSGTVDASDGSASDASDGGSAQDGGTTIATWQCGATTVSDCAQCTGFTQPCAYCNMQDASVVSGVCTLIHSNCLNSIPQGYQDCTCQDASTCPESYQVCTLQGRCHTCSDSTQNNTLKCENGGTCTPEAGTCQ